MPGAASATSAVRGFEHVTRGFEHVTSLEDRGSDESDGMGSGGTAGSGRHEVQAAIYRGCFQSSRERDAHGQRGTEAGQSRTALDATF